MYIPDLYAAIWASTCTIPDLDVSKVKIEGVEIDLLRHLKSKLLLQCGSCIVKIAGFKWPQVKLSHGDLTKPDSLTTTAGLGFFNNYCFNDSTEDPTMAPIYENARRCLGPDKIAKLACFDFARLKFESDMCITCIGMLPNFGQWEGNRNCVLRSWKLRK